MTKIPRYLDDPPSLFWWDVDEIIIVSIFFAIGIATNTLTYLLSLGFLVGYILRKVKQQQSDGFFLHSLYWLGVFPIKKCPPSYIKTYIE